MGKLPNPPKLKRVLLLVELEDGAIGAVYSDHLHSDATLEVTRREEEPGLFGPRPGRPSLRLTVGQMESLVYHEPTFHVPAVESMAQAVMDQWKMAGS